MQHHNRLTLQQAWPTIQHLLQNSSEFTVASVRPDGSPHITPIGSIMLEPDCRGLYIEKFPTNLPKNLECNPRICVYANSISWVAWIRGLLAGHTDSPMGVRLYGTAGPRRPLTPRELELFHRKVRFAKWTKGYEVLWAEFTHARDITFDHYEPILAGTFTRGHWEGKRPAAQSSVTDETSSSKYNAPQPDCVGSSIVM